MDNEWSVYHTDVKESGYDYCKFKEVLEISKEYLPKLNSKKRLKIIREVLKNPNFDDTDIYYLSMYELQKPTYKPPALEPKKPIKLKIVMRARQPIEPIREGKKKVQKFKKVGLERPCDSDREFDDEEEKGRSKKRATNNMVQSIVVPENTSELPAEFKERIQNLGGFNVVMVIQKQLFQTDIEHNNTRLSLPWRQINDMGFLSGEERTILNTKKNGGRVVQIMSRIIGENGLEHEIGIRQWNMKTSSLYNLVTGWNDVVRDHGLCAGMTVQLWSFRVEGNIWFALVKL